MSIQEKINKAFDAQTSASGLVHLNTAQADTFIDYIKDESVILQNARIKKMSAPMEKIAKIGVGEDIFHPATKGEKLGDTKRISVNGEEITLVTKEIMAEVKVLDDELEDNIEGGNFTETLMRLISKKGANQLERVALYSRKADGGDSISSLFDGYVKSIAANWTVVDATAEADRFISKEKLSKMYKGITTKYRSGLNKFYMPNDVAIDYESLYETSINDISKKGAFGVGFENVPLMSIERPVKVTSGAETTLNVDAVKGENTITVVATTGITAGKEITLAFGQDKEFTTTVSAVNGTTKVVTLTDSLPFAYGKDTATENTVSEVTRDWADVILTENTNLIWGVQRDITIETERSARERATYFVVTMRCDFAVENPEAAALLTGVKVK